MEKNFIIPEAALQILERAANSPPAVIPGLIQAALMLVRPIETPKAPSVGASA